MANPPPARPWFRLASIRPVPAPAPAPAPQTRPAQTREPTPPPPPPPQEAPPRSALDARTSSPSSPSHKAPSSPLPTSPLQKATVTSSSSVPSSPSRKPISTSSPQSPPTIKQAVHPSPMQSSPKLKPSSPPPSPLTLPPNSQLNTDQPKIPAEAEPKTVLVEKTVDKPRQWLNGSGDQFHREAGASFPRAHDGKHVSGKESEAKDQKGGIHRKLPDSEDSGMRVITIAGENRGAYMELVQSQKKHEPKHLHKSGTTSSKDKTDGSESESSSSGEGKGSKKDENNKGRGASSFPMAAYMNSNVQCVNNSLLFHASCSHHDPGVRLSLSKKPFGEGYHLKERVEGQNV